MTEAIEFLLKNWKTVLVTVVIVALCGAIDVQTAHLNSARTKISDLNAKASQLQAKREKQRADDERYARAVEGQLRDAAAATQKESHEKELALESRVAGLLGELRNRPERPSAGSQVAAVAAPAAGSTGAGLYRPDADFLVGEAAAATRIANERDACYRQYHDAEEALKKYQTE